MVYITDCGNNRVQKFTSEGEFVLQFGKEGGELNRAHGIAIDTTTDTVYISSDHKISVFTTDGKFLQEFGRQGSGDEEFNCPIGLAFDISSSDLYVCDFNNDRLVVY